MRLKYKEAGNDSVVLLCPVSGGNTELELLYDINLSVYFTFHNTPTGIVHQFCQL